MPQNAHAPAVSCLADVDVGDQVVIREILFDRIRSICAPLGVSQGDVLCCAGKGHHMLRLRSNAGRSFEFDRFYASFVEVEPALDGARTRA